MSNDVRLTVFILVYTNFILPPLKSFSVATDTTDVSGHKAGGGGTRQGQCLSVSPNDST